MHLCSVHSSVCVLYFTIKKRKSSPFPSSYSDQSFLTHAYVHPAPAKGDPCVQGISWKKRSNWEKRTNKQDTESSSELYLENSHAVIILRSPEVKGGGGTETGPENIGGI